MAIPARERWAKINKQIKGKSPPEQIAILKGHLADWPDEWRFEAAQRHRALAGGCEDDAELVLQVMAAWERAEGDGAPWVPSEKRQEWAKAFGAYKKAVELDPELIEPRISLAKIYLAQASSMKARKDEAGAANALGLAQEQIKEIRSRDPENTEALTLEANLWILTVKY